MFLRFNITISFLLLWVSCFAQLSLNELVSKSENSLIINNESPDWIELYNGGNDPIDLSNFYLSDNFEELNKWRFPIATIDANEYLVILADGLDLVDNYIHTNFALSSNGETLILSDQDLNIVEQVIFPALETDISFAKVNDVWGFYTPTPGMVNSGNEFEILPIPSFSHETQVLSNSINLEIISETDTQIEYFINDLAVPNLSNSETLVLNIANHTSICARAVKPGSLPSPTNCHSFIFEAHDLPILSIAAEEQALFDETEGLFELGPDAEPDWPFWGANFWSGKDELVYFQYFNHNSDLFYAQADLEMHGGRESRTNPQKTFRLLAKEKYQQAFFEFPFFDSKPEINSYKRLVIRNASGDFNAGHCRDGFLQDYLINKNLNLDANAYSPIAVYINGEYYGLMAFREKMDKFYTQSNFNTTDVDLLEEQGEVIEGSLDAFAEDYAFIRSKDLSQANNYEEAKAKFDVENLTDYFLSQICNNSTAWPQNNIKFWKGKEGGSKWRYLLFDMDISLGRHPWTFAEENSLLNKMTSFQDTNLFINTVYAFLDNHEFRNYFLNRHQDLYNTSFSTDSLLDSFNEFVPTIENEMIKHLNRWPTLTFEDWENSELERIRTFIRDRPDRSREYFNDFFNAGGLYQLTVRSNEPQNGTIDLNSLSSIRDNFSGTYFQGIPIRATAIPIDGKYFSHWEITTANNTRLYHYNELVAKFLEDTQITAVYRDSTGEDFVEFATLVNGQVKLKLNLTSQDPILVTAYDFSAKKIASYNLDNISLGENHISIPLEIPITTTLVITIEQGDQFESQKLLNLNF